LRRRTKLIIGVVVTLALLICGVTYLRLIEWPSIKPSVTQGVEIELLRSGEPTRTDDPWFGGYAYEVRFYNASDSEVAMIGASIRKEASQPQYQLMVSLAHHIETWYMLLDGPDPTTTHLESLSLQFNFSRRIEMLPLPLWLLTPAYPYPSNISGSFSLESKIVDIETGVVLLNFTRLRNLEEPPSSPVRWSWISFELLMGPESPETRPHFDAFTLTISFTLHLPSGSKVMYEKGTTTLDFQPPAAALQEIDPLVFHPLTSAIPRKTAKSSTLFPSYYSSHSNPSTFSLLLRA
jgi:hypothetical protein